MDHNMAKKVKLPFKRRVQDAFTDLFADKSDIRVPDATTIPTSIDKRNNTLVTAWHDQHRAIATFALANALKQAAEAWHKDARALMMVKLGIHDEKLEPGAEVTHTRDNVSVVMKVNQPQHRIDRETLRGVLMKDHKFTAEKADEVLKKSEIAGKPPVFLTPVVHE